MQIKQFEGTSMEEILARVKKTLGDDAVILSTRKHAKKKMGAFTGAVYEVSAAVDAPAPLKGIRTGGVRDTVVSVGATPAATYPRYGMRPAAPQRPAIAVVGDPPAPALSRPVAVPATPAAPEARADAPPAGIAAEPAAKPSPFEAFLSFEKELAPLKDEIASLKGFLELVVKEGHATTAAGDTAGNERLDRLTEEIRQLKAQLAESFAAKRTDPAGPAAAVAAPAEPPEGEASTDEEWLVRRLVAQGFSERAGRRIDKAVKARCTGRPNESDLRREAGEYLASLVRVAELPAALEGRPRILAFVGPAGAGKTSTVARVGRMLAKKGFRCGAIAVGDPARGAARLLRELQLPHGIPVLCANDGESLSRAVAVCYGAQYLLVDVEGDACGREAASRMTELFRGHANIDFCMTLPADWDRTPADRLVSSLSPLPVNYLAFTGIDKSARRGNMVKAAATAARPVLFLAGGDDRGGALFPARPYMFSRLLLEDTATETRMSR
jgi:flagellar biosynthesis GTPase FlhF